jgi:tRNA1Val (adenine37-N6)-methyltransferase
MSALTTDTFFKGRLKIQQTEDGYRFSIDAVLLASFIQPRPGDTILDLGTGCGILPLILASRYPDVRLWGIEVQEVLAELAIRNTAANGLENRITIMHRDLRELVPGSLGVPFRWVISNPPFRKLNSGRLNPHGQRAIARHEIFAKLNDITTTASRMLSLGGRFAAIYAAERLTDLLTSMRSVQLEPKRIRLVHSREDSEAKLVLVESVKGGQAGAKIGKPLLIWADHGAYTDEVAAMME